MNNRINSLVEQFVADITKAAREMAIDTLKGALGEEVLSSVKTPMKRSLAARSAAWPSKHSTPAPSLMTRPRRCARRSSAPAWRISATRVRASGASRCRMGGRT